MAVPNREAAPKRRGFGIIQSMTAYILLIGIAVFVAIRVLWDRWRAGRWFCSPIPFPYRQRPSQEWAWQECCQGKPSVEVDRLLTLLCEAFSFNLDNRYQFAPHDRVLEIYQAKYPRWKRWLSGDELEIESLGCSLGRRIIRWVQVNGFDF